MLVPKFSLLKVMKITETTSPEEVQMFIESYGATPKLIKKTNAGIVIRFTKSFRISLKPNSLLFYDGNRFNYVLAEDAGLFNEFFYNEADAHCIDVCYKDEQGWCCKHCGFHYEDPFANKCPNCGVDSKSLQDKINTAIKINSRLKLLIKKPTNKFEIKKYTCPICDYISLEPFTVCPSCSVSNETYQNTEPTFTDINTKLRKKKMCKENTQEVEEVEETQVTAVYGDCVSVNNSEVQSNPEAIKNDQETSNL